MMKSFITWTPRHTLLRVIKSRIIWAGRAARGGREGEMCVAFGGKS